MKLENYPIVKVLLPYVIGIMIAYFGDLPDVAGRSSLIMATASFVLVLMLTFIKAYRWRVVQTLIMNISFIKVEHELFVFSMNQRDFHFPFIWDGFNLPMILIRITE